MTHRDVIHFTRSRTLLYSVLVTALVVGALEGVARIVEVAIDEDGPALAENRKRLHIVLLGGSTVVGAPLAEVAFFEQFKVLLREQSEIGVEFLNGAADGLPSAAFVQQASRLIGPETDAVFVLSGHNEFLRPQVDAIKQQSLYRRKALLEHLAIARLAGRWIRHLGILRPSPPQIVLIDSYIPDPDRDREQRLRAFSHNLDAVIDLAEHHGVPVIVATAPSNMGRWPPRTTELEPYAQKMREASSAKRLAEASGILEQGLAIDPDDRSLRFLKGRLAEARGAYAEALQEYRFARDHDMPRHRAITAINEITRSKARSDQVTLIDVEKILAAASPHGITGFEMIADNCHPTPEASYLIASQLLERVRGLGLIPARLPNKSSRPEDARAVQPPLGHGEATDAVAAHLRSMGYYRGSPLWIYHAWDIAAGCAESFHDYRECAVDYLSQTLPFVNAANAAVVAAALYRIGVLASGVAPATVAAMIRISVALLIGDLEAASAELTNHAAAIASAEGLAERRFFVHAQLAAGVRVEGDVFVPR